jgi:methionine-rich copper-binding protein CopC
VTKRVGPLHARRLSAIALLCVLAAPCTPVHAHALLAKSEPARKATLARSPSDVRLWFNERLEPAFSSLRVLDAAGKPVTGEHAEVTADNPKRMTLALPPLPPGTYSVHYQVLSVDGHTVKASFEFTVKEPPAPR